RFSLMSFYEPADKALLKRLLMKADQLPEGARIQALEPILKDGEKGIEAFVEKAYAATRLKDLEFVQSLFTKSVKEIEAVNDPLLQLAARMYPETEAARKRNERLNARLEDLRRQYILALKARSSSPLYPDANSTLRFSWGEVAGYEPRDAVRYAPFTTLSGVMEKETGEKPFIVPEGLKAIYKEKDFGRWAHPDLNDVPVAFTHKVDSTGGNSGSPVFNARGELAGILFDGNYEALTGDWEFDNDIQRSISVDIRYVLFITEKLAKADHILKEMGL
ncbi:MAG TPA: S46 family peptidase, partial [Candidatus Aminicenantes bacterium]|nr:S46 family peptidase [Candidatus Aminicenantes bacterium]